MSKANDIQVAGTHYRTSFQHWDLAAECELGYFEGQVTKYVTRHRFKKGLEDAQKARHFLVKLVELAQAGKAPQSTGTTTDIMKNYGEANKLLPEEVDIIYVVINWSEPVALGYCIQRLDLLIDRLYHRDDTFDVLRYALHGVKVMPPASVARISTVDVGAAPTGEEPGAGYVNQG